MAIGAVNAAQSVDIINEGDIYARINIGKNGNNFFQFKFTCGSSLVLSGHSSIP